MNNIVRTRLVLTCWYSTILLIILFGFSVALSVTHNHDISRIVLRQDFGNQVPKVLSVTEKRLIAEQVRELRRTSLFDLVVIDVITLLFGVGLSYFLAGKTLDPIKKSIENQKAFVADASHELRNPIATIQTACEVVLRSSTKTREDYKQVVEQVFEQTQRLGRLVDDLLLLSVLDTEKTTNTFKHCSFSEIVEKEVFAMSSLIKKSGLRLEKNITPDVFLFADEDKVRQLVVILLDNAIKYSRSGGVITVKVLTAPQPQLIVQDTGIGIAVDKQKDIFSRFYRVDQSRTGNGAGLGMAIAKSIIHLHNATIKVESKLGKGSTFTCTFPKTHE